MSGLVLKLSPAERFYVNGAVIENGGRRAQLRLITPNTNILRHRDALHPRQVNTPVKRVCYIAELILMGNCSSGEATQQLLSGIDQLAQVFLDEKSLDLISSAAWDVEKGNTYKALKCLRALIPLEQEIIELS